MVKTQKGDSGEIKTREIKPTLDSLTDDNITDARKSRHKSAAGFKKENRVH